jgi:Family of unknown function (DUF6065)
MKLIAHVLDGHHVDIRSAPVEREWMDETNQRFSYRRLPLNIANAFGWEVLCNAGFLATWDGGTSTGAITVEPDPGTQAPAVSHFGHGNSDLPPSVPVSHRTRLEPDGAGTDQPAEGRHCRSCRHHRDQLGALKLHHELDLHAA